jgi:urea ABC transporter urea binding protein
MNELQIGILHSLTGTMASSECPLVNATLLAVEEINAQGGLLKRQLKPCIADGESDPEVFALQAGKLLREDRVATLFGCWTSASRKAILSEVERTDALLWYPVQYEGLEQSQHIIYSGSCPNQQINPAVNWALAKGWRRCLLVGSDYVFPRTANLLIASLMHSKGGEVIGDHYIPLGGDDFADLMDKIRTQRPDVIFNTLNGDSNLGFFRQFHAAGFAADELPVISFSITEDLQHQIAGEAIGHYACASYFQTLDTPANRAFLKQFRARFGADQSVSDAMVAAYDQVHLWRLAVEAAKSTARTAILEKLPHVRFAGPGGDAQVMPNHHLRKAAVIGCARADGQFDIVWCSDGVIDPKPWLGVADLELESQQMVLETMRQLPNVFHYANQLETEITRRQAAEAELIASNQKFQALVNDIGDKFIIYSHLPTGELTYVSEGITTVMGLRKEEVLGQNWAEMFDWLPGVAEEGADVEARMERGELDFTQYEMSYRHPNHEIRTIWVSEHPVRDANGKVLSIDGIVEDVTERKRIAEQLRQFKTSLDLITDCVFMFWPDTLEFFYTNRGATVQIGYSEDELRHMTPIDIKPQYDEASFRALIAPLVSGEKESITFETVHAHRDGHLVPVEIFLQYVAPMNEPARLVAIVRDITEHKRLEAELRIAAIAFETQKSMLVTDANTVIIRVNQAFTHLTGYKPEDVIGKSTAIFNSGRQDPEFYQRMWQSLKDNGYWQGVIWNKRKNGKIDAEWLAISAIIDPGGTTTHYVATYSDVTENKEAEAEVHRLAYYDTLTQLPNRRLLQDRLEQSISSCSSSGRYGALLLVDLDHLKKINDTFGHEIGDQLLVEAAQRLTRCAPEVDTLARFGGDEFALLLEELSAVPYEALVKIEQVAEDIRKALAQPYNVTNRAFHITTSIGIVQYRAPETADVLLQQATVALHGAKNAGRDCFRFFDPEMQAMLEQRMELEEDLYLAVESGELELYYQPQIDSGGRLIGAEALLRWRHPEKGLISPGEFIPLAEENGLILPIGLWALETACAQIKAWSDKPAIPAFQVAVNVSARQFQQPDFIDRVEQILARTGVDAKKLKIELTESVVLSDINDTLKKMRALKALGLSLSLDDFGTGQSSLSYLTRMPLDQLKIDRSFVISLPDNRNDAILAQTIIAMGQGLGLDVIAEGVETAAQREFLDRHGCHLYQGYLYSRPLPVVEFEGYLQRIESTQVI